MATQGRRAKMSRQLTLDTDPQGLLVPEGYEILRVLGRGGCAVVYEAKHPQHGVVALKLTDGHARLMGSVDRRLSREGELLARVSHENVLRVYDAGRTPNGAPYLAMEFLHGEDVESVLLRKGPLVTSIACEIVRQVLAALEAVHAAGIIHRDLKPNNVMIDVPANGARPVVKLIDFGIAKGAHVEKLTETGSLVGTPQYLAPEQVRGAPVDERADVWAAGILFFELLTARTPFDGLGLEETFGATLYAEVPDVRSVRADVPESIARLIAHALERDTERRPRSARAMREALEEAVANDRLDFDQEAFQTLPAIRKRTLPFGLAGFDMGSRRASIPMSSLAMVPAASTPAGASFDFEPTTLPSSFIEDARTRALRVMRSSRERGRTLVAIGVACALALVLVGRRSESVAASDRVHGSAPHAFVHPSTTVPLATPEAARGATVGASAASAATTTEDATNAPARVAPSRAPSRARERLGAAHAVPKLAGERVAERARRAYARGEIEEANVLYDRATELAPSYAPAWRGYALTSYELGHSGTARRAMRRYRALITQLSE